jgi:toxin YoeB
MIKIFSDIAWEDYQYWIRNDRKVLKKVNGLLKDIERGGNEGLGKPEPLTGDLQGYWSRRITLEHRLIYKLCDEEIRIARCRSHYSPVVK